MSQTEQRLQAYLDAEAKVLDGQIVQFGDDQISMPTLFRLQDQIEKLRRQLATEKRLARGGSGTRVSLADFSGGDA